MPKRTKDFAPHISPDKAPACYVAGCSQIGTYKAPRSRDKIDEYDWFCLDHIRERNKQWDYFSGMNADEIEAFISDSVTGHRPTWSRESRVCDHYFTLQDKLYEFMHGTKPTQKKLHIPAKLRKALATMELEHPYNLDQLKSRYRILVKQYHPDLNKGDKKLEEKFKDITTAYSVLLQEITSSPDH